MTGSQKQIQKQAEEHCLTENPQQLRQTVFAGKKFNESEALPTHLAHFRVKQASGDFDAGKLTVVNDYRYEPARLF